MEQLNEGIINVGEIDIMSTIITISLVIHVLSLKCCWISVPNIKNKLTDKIQSLERHINETKKSIHIWTDEFRAEATAPLHYKTEGEHPRSLENQP